jgi:hypothetical protein
LVFAPVDGFRNTALPRAHEFEFPNFADRTGRDFAAVVALEFASGGRPRVAMA